MSNEPKAAAVFNYLSERIHKRPELSQTNAIIQFNILGDPGGHWVVDLTTEPGTIREGTAEAPDCTIIIHDDDFDALTSKRLKPMTAFMQGKIKVQGNMALVMKLQGLLG